MPNAILTTTNYAGDGTQLKLINAISDAMLTAGFTLLDSYLSTGEARVWSFDTAEGFAYDDLILELAFTNNTNGWSFKGYSTYDTANNAGTNASSTVVDSAFNLTSSFTFHIISHPEIRGVMIIEGVEIKGFIGYLRPDPTLAFNSWWNRNTAPYAYIIRMITGDFTVGLSMQTISALRPGSIGISQLIDIDLTTGNSGNLGMRLLLPCVLGQNGGGVGLFSTDLALAGAAGMTIGDYLPIGTSEYTLFSNSVAHTCKLFVKTA